MQHRARLRHPMVNPSPLPSLWTYLLCLCIFSVLSEAHYARSFRRLSDGDITTLSLTPDPLKNLDPSNPSSHIAKILIPRPPDTANNTLVREYLVSTLKTLKWDVEVDHFEADTPYGKKKMANVIATKDPNAPRRVVLAAHFDSKFFPSPPENQFVGATDSAAPCALLLDLAEALNPLLDHRQKLLDAGDEEEEDSETADTTLQIVFLDGEEAFQMWTATDSIYGARHLAAKWEDTYVPSVQARRIHPPGNKLSSIDHFILLDLLGAPKPSLHSYYLSTAWLFDELILAETRLLTSHSSSFVGDDRQSFFVSRGRMNSQGGGIQDDHLPFLERGVNILHLIASPFPSVWHTIADDASALHLPTLRRWNLIFRVFVAEYLGLRPPPPGRSPRSELVGLSYSTTPSLPRRVYCFANNY